MDGDGRTGHNSYAHKQIALWESMIAYAIEGSVQMSLSENEDS